MAARQGPGLKKIEPIRSDGKGGRTYQPEVLEATHRLLTGHLRSVDIVRRIVADFGMSERQAHRYLAHARNELAIEHDEQKPRYKHYARATLQWVIRKGMTDNKLAIVVSAIDRLARLYGLYDEIKMEHTHVVGSGVLVDDSISGSVPLASAPCQALWKSGPSRARRG